MLWEMMKDKVRKQDIADYFHLSLDGVRYRENRLKGIVRCQSSTEKVFIPISDSHYGFSPLAVQ